MTSLVRDVGEGAPVEGVRVEASPKELPGEQAPLRSYRADGNLDVQGSEGTIRARSVVIATGGSSSHVSLRRMFDPGSPRCTRPRASRTPIKAPAASSQ